MKLKFTDLSPTPPKLIYDQLRNSRYAAGNGAALVIQADASRSQTENKEDCFSKLGNLIKEVCGKVIVKEASAEQQAKVKKLYFYKRCIGYRGSNNVEQAESRERKAFGWQEEAKLKEELQNI